MKARYEIIQTEGCYNTTITVNEQDLYSDVDPMTLDEKEELVDHLFKRFKYELKRNNVTLDSLIQCFDSDDYETEEDSCETCGHSMATTTWRL